MSTVTVKDVQKLNKRIEEINTERTRVETRTQMLRDQVWKDIEAYEKQFGVSLKAKNFSEVKKLVAQEAKKVADAVEEEYRLKEKVVGCIESGEIDEANRLLGIVVESEETDSEEDLVEEETAPDGENDMDEMDSFFSTSTEEEVEVAGGNENEEEEDTDAVSDLGFDVSKLGSVSPTEEPVTHSIPGDMFAGFEDDEPDEGNDDAVMAEDLEDEDEDDPFGFGSMLSGGKF